MNSGKACAIFLDIENDKWTEGEKLEAIKIVLDMETHNHITKSDILRTFKWFFDFAVEEQ